MPSITVTGFADFMCSSDAAKETLLKNYKHASEEQRARAKYYQWATSTIRKFHQDEHDISWLASSAREMENRAATEEREGLQRQYRAEAKAVRNYARHFGNKRYSLIEYKFKSQYFDVDDVRIKVWPEFHAIEGRRERFIKLKFSKIKGGDAELWAKIVGQLVLETIGASHQISGAAVRVLYVPEGIEYANARVGARMTRNIEASCRALSDMWKRI